MNWEYAFEQWLEEKGDGPVYHGIPWRKLGDMTRRMVKEGFKEGFNKAHDIFTERERNLL